MTLRTTEQWESWFIQAGIQPEYAMQYATNFVINRVDENCLSGLTKDYLKEDLCITCIGDIICILNAAERHKVTLASSASTSQSAPIVSHHHAKHMGASSSDHPDVTPPRGSAQHANNSIRIQAPLASFDGGQFTDSPIYIGDTKIITYSSDRGPKEPTIAKRSTLILKDCDLKKILNKNAKVESGKFTSSINPQLSANVNPVPLKMTSNMHRSLAHLDDEGHYNTRSDFKKILDSRSGDLTLEQLFEKANKQAQAQAKSQTTEEAKSKYIQLHGNTVTLLGQAGIGKTTLARKMLEIILDGKLFPDTQYLFFIPIRKLNFDEITFLQFALIGCSEHWHYGPETDKLLLEKLRNEQNIVFIFDGLDEGKIDQLREEFVGVLGDKAKPHVFLRNILCGDFLPHSKKVVTSRPRQFFELHSDCRKGFVVDILGLNTDGRNKLCEQICGKNYKLVKQYLDEHPDVSASCYVPVKCIIILLVLSTTINECGDIDIQSLTDIFVQALGYYVRSPHVGDYAREVWKLADLAWQGFLKKKIIFDTHDFKSANISSEAFGSFLETFVDSAVGFQCNLLEGDRISSFSHLVWQELFAATNLMVLMPACIFKSYLNQLNDSAWEVVAVFVFGFFNQSVMKKIKRILSKEDIAIEEWEEKKKSLTEHLLDMALSVKHDTSKLLRLCSWIHEANSDELNKEVLPHLPQTFQLGREKIYPTDVSDIIYILSKANQPFYILIVNYISRRIAHDNRKCNFTHDSFKRLCKCLSGLSLKMKLLCLSYSKINDDGAKSLAACLHNIEVLRVRACAISNIGMEAIASNLIKLNTAMKLLDISFNKFCDDGAKSLATCMHNIAILIVRECGITNIGMKEIASNLVKLNKPMTVLDISWNMFGDDGAKSLAACLHNIEVLDVSYCGITNIGMEEIANNLVNLNKPMGQLNLSYNMFGDDGAKSLAACLHNIEMLVIRGCGITNIGMKDIASNLVKLNKPMKKLDLIDNMLGDDGAKSLAACLHNIEVLDVSYCGITNIGMEEIASKLVKLNKPMKKLDLSDNKLGDDGAKSLAACLHNIEVLDVTYCEIGDVGVEAIKNKLATLDQAKHKVVGLDNQFEL